MRRQRVGGVHGRALQGVHGQLKSGLHCPLGAMGVLVGKKSRIVLHQAVLAGNATLSVGEFHRVRLRGEVHGRAHQRVHGH